MAPVVWHTLCSQPQNHRVLSHCQTCTLCVRVCPVHTALDDNRMLCLPSGERIRLDESRLRLLFEVEDLAAASPATVSRCVRSLEKRLS